MLDYLAAVDEEAFQIAKETDEGVAATTGFLVCPSLSLTPKRDPKFDQYKRSGSRHTSASRLNTNGTTLQVAGGADYNEIGLLLAGALRTPTSAPVVGTTLAHQHTGVVLADAPNSRLSFTAQWGKGAYIRQVTGLRVESFGLKTQRTGSIDVSGAGFATAIEDSYNDGITLAAGATELAQSSMSGLDIGYYLADDPADLATADLLADAFGGEVMLAAIAAAVWSHNRLPSHSGSAEQKDQKGTAKLFLPVRDTYHTIYRELEQGKTYYLRQQALGPIIEGTTRFALTIDVAVKIAAGLDEKAEQNVLALEIPFIWADDLTWGQVATYKLINTVAGY